MEQFTFVHDITLRFRRTTIVTSSAILAIDIFRIGVSSEGVLFGLRITNLDTSAIQGALCLVLLYVAPLFAWNAWGDGFARRLNEARAPQLHWSKRLDRQNAHRERRFRVMRAVDTCVMRFGIPLVLTALAFAVTFTPLTLAPVGETLRRFIQ